MAEEEKNEETTENSSNKEGGGNKLLMVVIIILLLLLLVIGGLVAYFLLSDSTTDPEKNPEETTKTEKVEKKKVTKNSDDLTVGPIYPMDNFVVNLMSDGARRFLKCAINLEMDTPELQPEIDSKVAPIRDIIIRILSSKTVAEVSTSKGKEKLKEEIVRKINERLEAGEIRHVYFVEFVIQ
jgi:flagellar FliL protein